MAFLERLAGCLFLKTLVQRYAVEWEWPNSGDSADAWERETVPCGRSVLAALYGRAAGPARGVVVCVPPITRASKGFFLTRGYGAALRAAGYDVLLFDLNGFGESPYRSIDYDADILAVGHAAARKRPGLPVGFLGVCFGASFGVLALTCGGHPFQAAVFESPYANFQAVLKAMDRHVTRTQAYRRGARLTRVIAPFFQRYHVPRQAQRVVGLEHALFVACGRDTLVPPESVHELAHHVRQSPSPAARRCEVYELPEGEHLGAAEAEPGDYFGRIVHFFDAAFSEAVLPCEPASGGECTAYPAQA